MLSPVKSSPQKISHPGKYCRLEPINPEAHLDDLWSVAGRKEDIWEYLLSGPWSSREDFFEWLKSCENHPSRTYYVVIDEGGKALGALSLIDCDMTNATIEIGGIFFAKELQRTNLATEAIYLLSRYAFEGIGCKRLQWKCNLKNEASKKAALRFGFKAEGVLRNHMISKGKSRDTAFFSIIDSEWPNCRDAFEGWLAPENFDADGRQKERLEEFRVC